MAWLSVSVLDVGWWVFAGAIMPNFLEYPKSEIFYRFISLGSADFFAIGLIGL
jgi:hypothetical protein